MKHLVVAGTLALDPETVRGEPHEWVEPVDGGDQLTRELSQVVATFHMHELVTQHQQAALGRPPLRFLGDQHDRSPPSPRHRDRCAGRAQESNRPVHAQLATDVQEHGAPLRRRDLLRPMGETSGAPHAEERPRPHRRDAEKPDGQRQARHCGAILAHPRVDRRSGVSRREHRGLVSGDGGDRVPAFGFTHCEVVTTDRRTARGRRSE